MTLNYVTIPGVPQRQIDPTFMSLCLHNYFSSFGVQTGKKKEEEKPKEEKMRKLLDVLTVVSFLGTAGIIGAGAYVYIQKMLLSRV